MYSSPKAGLAQKKVIQLANYYYMYIACVVCRRSRLSEGSLRQPGGGEQGPPDSLDMVNNTSI